MSVRILQGDVREVLPTLLPDTFDCAVTSPPYFGLRDYGCEVQIGLEPTLDAYLDEIISVCREVRRVLKPEGTFFLNIGDSYAGSWGAQGRQGATGQMTNRSVVSARQIEAAQKRTSGTGSINRSPGLKPKDLMMVPARLALALQADGWWLRSEIVWHKPNPMPESVTDRPTSAHEKIFMFTKSERYFFDAAAVREKASVATWEDGSRTFGGVNKHGANVQHGERTTGCQTAPRKSAPKGSFAGKTANQAQPAFRAVVAERNIRNVWTMATTPYAEAHFATFPPELVERCIKAGCPVGGHILDPFGGAGTTGLVADRLQRSATLIELNPSYAEMARRRIANDAGMFASAAE